MSRLLRSAWADLGHHRLRNALSALTMFVGVLSLVLVSAASDVAGDLLLAREEQARGRALTWQAIVNLEQSGPAAAAERLGERLALLAADDAATAVTISGSVTVDDGDTQHSLEVAWVYGDLAQIRRLPVLAGQFPLPQTMFPPQIALNELAAQELGCGVGCVLQATTSPEVAPATFVVAAIIADGATEAHGYAPVAAMPLTGASESSATILVTTGQGDPAKLQRLVEDALLDVGLDKGSEVMRADTTDQVTEQTAFLRAIFSALSAVMLSIAALGILNVGLASVDERRRELVVRRAVGARKLDLFLLVMGSAVLTGIMVAVAAIAAALAVVYVAIPSLIPLTTGVASPPFPWTACLLGLGAAVATSAAGSCFPAWRAARLPVAHALRD